MDPQTFSPAAGFDPQGALPEGILRFWGKTGQDAAGRETYHPLAFHCLDVAACGRRLLEVQPLGRRRLARRVAMDEDALVGWCTFLLALHDLGKLADGFQGLAPEWMARLQGTVRPQPYSLRHDSLAYELLAERDLPVGRAVEALAPTDDPYSEPFDRLAPWLRAAAGHHGQPPHCQPPHCQPPDGMGKAALQRQFPAPVMGAAVGFLAWARERFCPAGLPGALASDPLPDEEEDQVVSWWFAGLAVTADWTGSNLLWFPHRSATSGPFAACSTAEQVLELYWESEALPRAARAVREAGLEAPRPAVAQGLRGLWPGYRPTPLQVLAEELPLASGPQLVVIEEATGGGKTEAALVLAHRLMASGEADGLYIALPTQATANAMVDRVETMFRKLYLDPPDGAPPPSLILAHSRRHLRRPDEDRSGDESLADQETGLERLGEEQPPRGERTDLEHGSRAPGGAAERGFRGESVLARSGTAECTAWLADSRKRALLADVGVGTIDQALIGVLPLRHQSVRLWGLAGKVLVVDEVHACDDYVRSLLKGLLTFHAAFGGSAILLSATLPQRQRAELVRAFQAGAAPAGAAPALASSAYPLVTRLADGRVTEETVATRPEVRRRVGIEWLHGVEAAEAVLLEAARAGRCACWIRNTVADAREAHGQLVEALGEPDRVTLFHSRFTVEDRGAIEARVLDSFGPKSGSEERAGRILVATQVVEQSLDLDFDLMVSDLAPVDLLVQRMGRLQRHRRDPRGHRIDGPDERGGPILQVLAPPLVDEPEASWYSSLFAKGQYVYPDHGRLWLGARTLDRLARGSGEESGGEGLRIPEDLRELIEAVYGWESDEALPEGLQKRSDASEGERLAAQALGRSATLDLARGYETSSTWLDDAHTPTRLGEPTVTVRLARREGERLVPFHRTAHRPWERSELTVRQRELAGEDPAEQEALEALREQLGGSARWVLFLVMEPVRDGWVGRGLDRENRPITFHYDSEAGFRGAP